MTKTEQLLALWDECNGNLEQFKLDVTAYKFQWFELTTKSIRVLTGRGTVIDFTMGY